MQQRQEAENVFIVLQGYEVQVGQEWRQRSGRVPVGEERPARVWVTMSRQGLVEEQYESEQWTSFTKGQRRRLTEAMTVLGARLEKHCSTSRKVTEVYSPPRTAPKAPQFALEAGSSIDLDTGWDLESPRMQKDLKALLAKEDPTLLILCPPCTAFTVLQNLNFPKKERQRVARIVAIGHHHLHFAVQLANWQMQRGAYFLLEQPWSARSWQDEHVEALLQKDQARRVRSDMCMFGMNVSGEGLNRKPTGVATNCPGIAKELAVECDGTHFHCPTISGKPKLAQVYPPKFCTAILRGLQHQLVEDGHATEVFVEENSDGEDADTAEVGAGRAPAEFQVPTGEAEDTAAIAREEINSVRRLHNNTGHPHKTDLVRFMRAARVRAEVIRWTAKHFDCDICKSKAKPKSARPAMIPRSYQPSKVVGVDLVFLPEVGGGTFPALSIVDWGTNYQMVERVASKDPGLVWRTLEETWFRIFGPPEVLVADPGREFLAEFMERAASLGVVVYQTASRAPWQQGKTERHGAHFKELLDKARSEVVITTQAELKSLMTEVEQAKNRFMNRSGFSPVQRQIGQWPRVPGNLLSDEGIDPILIGGGSDDFERMLEMRRAAQRAFAEVNAGLALRRATKGRSRTVHNYQAGDLVYVYRIPRARKHRSGTVQSYEVAINKEVWVGPGTGISG